MKSLKETFNKVKSRLPLLKILLEYPKVFSLRVLGGISDEDIVMYFSNIDNEYSLYMQIGGDYYKKIENRDAAWDWCPGVFVARTDGNLQVKDGDYVYENILDRFDNKEVRKLLEQERSKFRSYYISASVILVILSIIFSPIIYVILAIAIAFMSIILFCNHKTKMALNFR